MSLETLRALEQTIRKEIPGFEVRFKDESRFMLALGFLVQPFNPTFMTHYTTTIGSTVYFSSREQYEGRPDSSIVTLAHEFVHMYDSQRTGIRFQLSYAMPQLLALPVFVAFWIVGSVLPLILFLLGYAVLVWIHHGSVQVGADKRLSFWMPLGVVAAASLGLAVGVAGWWVLVLLVGLACLGPWAANARTAWELRGYTMNLAVHVWVRNALPPEGILKDVIEQFTGSAYWFMCRDAKKVEDHFAVALRSILERQLQRELPYSVVHRFLVEQGRAAPAFSE